MPEKPGLNRKKVPQRRCSGCGERKGKKELVRVVRAPSGECILDETGKANGRGAYICPKKSCLLKAKKSGRIARSLEISIPEEVWEQLAGMLEE